MAGWLATVLPNATGNALGGTGRGSGRPVVGKGRGGTSETAGGAFTRFPQGVIAVQVAGTFSMEVTKMCFSEKKYFFSESENQAERRGNTG